MRTKSFSPPKPQVTKVRRRGKKGVFGSIPAFVRKTHVKSASFAKRLFFGRRKKPRTTWYSSELNGTNRTEENAFRTASSRETEFPTTHIGSSFDSEMAGRTDNEHDNNIITDSSTVAVSLTGLNTASRQVQAPVYSNPNQYNMEDETGRQDLLLEESCSTAPVLEVLKNHRRNMPSDLSDVSSLSGNHRLEFNLERGLGNKSSYKLPLSNDILQSLERQHHLLVNAKCKVLLLDPLQKIFEIVTVPNVDDTTTLGDILSSLSKLTSDQRLARLRFSGICSSGVFFNAPGFPMDVILAAQPSKTPLFAVPVHCSSDIIISNATALLNTPQVAQLLELS